MMKILQVTLGLDADARAVGAAGAAGVHGVLHHASPDCGACCVTDLVQFVLKMGMVVALAYYAVRAVGGLAALEDKVRALDAAAGSGSRLAFFPATDSAWMPAITLFVYLGVSWWASWYPGRRAGRRRLRRAADLRGAATSATGCSRRSGSTSRTTRCGRGRGF